MLRKNVIGALAGMAVFGALFGTSGTADAAWRRFNASGCMPMIPNNLVQFNTVEGVVNLSTSASSTLACPIVEDSSLWLDMVTSIKVDVTQGTAGNVIAYACVLYDQSAGGACGGPANTTGPGAAVLSPGNGVWNQTWFGETYSGDYGYIQVWLAPKSSSGTATANSIRGYNISG
jgi:hypothetical protein